MDGNNEVIRYGNDKRTCCVPLCNNHGNFYKEGKKIGYFTFPTKEPEKSIWIEKCSVTSVENFKPRTSFVCTDHFYEDEIEYFPFSKKWRRKPGVMPSRFHCWTSTPKTEPEESNGSCNLVAPSASTIEKLKLPDALGIRPNFTETLGMLSGFDNDVPSNILKDDPNDLSNAPLDLEAIIENPYHEETDKCAEEASVSESSVISGAKRRKIHISPSALMMSTSENNKEKPKVTTESGLPLKVIKTETVPQSILLKQAPVETDSDSYDGFSDSEEDSDEDIPWSSGISLPAQSDPHNTSSAIDINTILASANNASSILSAAMNTTSTSFSQEKIQKRIQKATCINCSAMFLDPRDLKKHILTHKKTLYACELCNEKFPTVFLLKKHSRVHHQALVASGDHGDQTGSHGNDK